MGRVPAHRPRPAEAAPGFTRHREQTNGTKPAYKVVMEEVTQKKKSLIILECSTTKPPLGYVFVAAGNPELTLECKELARQKGDKIFVVSTTKHKDTELSNQVHRAGYHFPKEIVRRACNNLSINFSDQETILNQHLLWPKEDKTKGKSAPKGAPKGPKKGTAKNGQSTANISQDDVDYEALQAIKDLFPAMPAEDSRNIVRHAFDLNTKRVGALVNDLPLPRRVQLAVVAHIRHGYTTYDQLLRQVPYQSARSMVESKTLEKLAEWRGNEKDDPYAMEDILREVIVIPEDDDEDNGRKSSTLSTRRPNIERAPENVVKQTASRPVDEYQAVPYRGRSIDSEEMQAATALGNGQYVFQHRRDERAGAHRIHAWEEARNRVRNPGGRDEVIQVTRPSGRTNVQAQPAVVLLKEAPHPAGPSGVYANHIQQPSEIPGRHSRGSERYVDDRRHTNLEPLPVISQRPPISLAHPNYVYEPVPKHLQRSHLEESRVLHHDAQRTNRQSVPPYAAIDYHNRLPQHQNAMSSEETILPSIEPASPAVARFPASRPFEESDVIVLDSPIRNGQRKRPREEYNGKTVVDLRSPGPTAQWAQPRREDIVQLVEREPKRHALNELNGLQQRDRPVHPEAFERHPHASNARHYGHALAEGFKPSFASIPHSQADASHSQSRTDANISFSSVRYAPDSVHSSDRATDRRFVPDSLAPRPHSNRDEISAHAAAQRELHRTELHSYERLVDSRPSRGTENVKPLQSHDHRFRALNQPNPGSGEYSMTKNPALDEPQQGRGSRPLPLETTFRNLQPISYVQNSADSDRIAEDRRRRNEASWSQNSLQSSSGADMSMGNYDSRAPRISTIPVPGDSRRPLDVPRYRPNSRDDHHPSSRNNNAPLADIVEGVGGRLYDRRTGREVIAIR